MQGSKSCTPPPLAHTDPEETLLQLGYSVHEVPLHDTWALWPGGSKIFILPTLPTRLRRAALHHEVAHITLGHGACSALSEAAVDQREREADEWAARRLIPLDKLAATARWADSLAEIAEELDVPGHWVELRMSALNGLYRPRWS